MGVLAKGAVRTVILALVIDLVGFTMILPLFPTVLESYRKNDPSGLYESLSNVTKFLGNIIGSPKAQSESVLIGGILGSLFCFLQFLSAPILGAYSDLKGRRQALITCLVS